ncbi:MAG TPA: TolC family protein [Pirellulales bacterium]|jgi:outer membrane protein TolC|nr:TolC family protein [Pirellulales bacterium]
MRMSKWVSRAAILVLIARTAPGVAGEPGELRAPGLLEPASTPALPNPPVRLRRLPAVSQPNRPVSYIEPAPSPRVQRAGLKQPSTAQNGPTQPEEVMPRPANGYPIDLPTALRLADADNLQVAFAREQVNLALAQVDQAYALWLPSVRGGVNYNRHEGAIQRVEGTQILNSRGAFYAGLGAGGYGAASPPIPGLYANFNLADALFTPLAARQFAAARSRAASAAANDILLQVAIGYFELLRAGEDIAISNAVRSDTQRLAKLTADYAATGAGLESDASRVRAEVTLRVNDVRRAREAQAVSSARLAQLLRLDPTIVLEPGDAVIVPIEVVPRETHLRELVAQALSMRPELAENRALVSEAVMRLRKERMGVILPSIVMGASYGGMGSGIHEQLAPFHDRLDVDAIAYWELRNFGFGEAAVRRGAESTVRATQLRQMLVMDQIAREISEAYAQVESRREQIDVAKSGIQAASESYRLNVERIEQALGLPIEVLQSIQALALARREYLRTLIEFNTAQFTLYRALGWPSKMPVEMVAAPGG